jgi:RNA polymerase sporulation-specific sigma factor
MIINPQIKEDPDKFIEDNMGLAKSVAWQYIPKIYNHGIEKDDIISMAYIGLIKAYERFDPSTHKGKNNKPICFSTYAVPVIRGVIRNNIRDHYNLLNIPRILQETGVKIRNAGYTRDDNANEISEKLNIPLKLVESALIILEEEYLLDSLDRKIKFNKNREKLLKDVIIGDSGKDIERTLIINEFLSSQPIKTNEIYKLRVDGFSQQEVGEIIGMSPQNVSKIEHKMYKMAENYCNDIVC